MNNLLKREFGNTSISYVGRHKDPNHASRKGGFILAISEESPSFYSPTLKDFKEDPDRYIVAERGIYEAIFYEEYDLTISRNFTPRLMFHNSMEAYIDKISALPSKTKYHTFDRLFYNRLVGYGRKKLELEEVQPGLFKAYFYFVKAGGILQIAFFDPLEIWDLTHE